LNDRLGIRWSVWAALFLTALAVPGATAWGQLDGYVFQTPDRELLQRLSRAEEAIQEERFGDAVLELGTLLSGPGMAEAGTGDGQLQDYFVGPTDESGVRRSIKGDANRLLGSLPQVGRELYELQFGAAARALLDEAVVEGDVGKLSEVVRRYFHTQSGYEAMVLLGRVHLDRGHPLAAALCFQRLLEAPAAVTRYDPELSVLLAACWADGGMPEKARQTLADVRRRFPDRRLRLEGRDVALGEGDLLAWLERYVGNSPAPSRSEAAEWLVHRGNAERNASSSGGLPLTNFRWQVPTPSDPSDEKLIRELIDAHASQMLPAIPGVQPLVVRDVVLMRAPEHLQAVDFRTGKRVWEYPWGDYTHADVPQAGLAGSPNGQTDERKLELQQRLWQDAAYGQISSDGESVYLLSELDYASEAESPQRMLPGIRRFPQQQMSWQVSHNQLVALDLAREGYLRWQVGGETGGDEPELAGAFFLGPPLPLLGQLYAIVEARRELRLVVLDPVTGRQAWSQQLAHVEDMISIGLNRERRLAGATPSFGDGVLVCPTSAGAVVAIDIATRSLLWGYTYDASSLGNGIMPFRTHSSRSNYARNPGESWADASVTIVDGSVVLTPVESDELICLDLLTGRPKWEPLNRESDLGEAIYVACAYDGKLVLVGKNEVSAIELKDGNSAWPDDIVFNDRTGEMPSGRGFRSGHHYFLPTTSSQLLKIDLTTGKIVDRADTGTPLGNLVCYGDHVISQGVDRVAAFYQVDPLRQQVADRLAKSADDPWALARQGELLIHDGAFRDALDVLWRAIQVAPADADTEEVRAKLVATYLRVLRDDFEIYSEFGSEVADLIEQPDSRREYLRLVAAGFERRGDHRRAADNYIELADLTPGGFDFAEASDVPLIEIDAELSVRLERRVAARLSALYRLGDADLRTHLDAVIADRHNQLDRLDDVALQRFINIFGFHPLADEARADLVPLLATTGRFLAADMLLGRLVESAPREVSGKALAEIAEAARASSRVGLAAAYYRQMRAGWADTPCLDGKTGRTLSEQALSDPAFLASADIPLQLEQWPYGKAETSVVEAERNLQAAVQRDFAVPLVETQRHPTRALFAVVRGSERDNALVLLSGAGDELLRLPTTQEGTLADPRHGLNYAAVYGQLMVAVTKQRVVAADLTRNGTSNEAVLWQKLLSPLLPDVALQRRDGVERRAMPNPLDRTHTTVNFAEDALGNLAGAMGPISEAGVVLVQGRTLSCLDPVTGAPFWRRQLADANMRVFGDEQYLFVAGLADESAIVLRADDGEVVGERRVPSWDNRWSTSGRYVLAWEQRGDHIRLYLYDAWDESDVWSELVSLGSRGCLFGPTGVAVCEPSGRLLVRSQESAELTIDAQLEPVDDLYSIHVLPTGDDLIVTTSSAGPTKIRDSLTNQQATDGLAAPLFDGRIYSFHAKTGEPNWRAPAQVDGYSLLLTQPHEVPTLWFMRHSSSRESLRAPAPTVMTSVLCLDRRDGRVLLTHENVPSDPGQHRFRVDHRRHRVELDAAGQRFVVSFTDQPAPPAPPAQTQLVSDEENRSGRLKRIAGSVIHAILNGQPERPEDDDRE